ncbi:sodium-dependent nutrient amino acid transporter 1 [Hyalella azteca]|uniref:Sodium-dependent nutrient amino acid transporter 1 n=1 Tax=Hyalella azteca TaxID=294128 RepID=A0A8B7NQH8_HYAAZ|nr:sodium-dependent nutrient amino acid transporter 1 [Hyalella azteca]
MPQLRDIAVPIYAYENPAFKKDEEIVGYVSKKHTSSSYGPAANDKTKETQRPSDASSAYSWRDAENADGKTSPPEEDGEHRDQWGNPIEFLLSCISMSVGLGNFWRFPTTAYQNGGGAFLIPYLVVLFFIGRPLYFLELSLGQFTSQSMVKYWNVLPALKGVGYAQAIASSSVVCYYSSIIAISIFYLVMSFQSQLPWAVCDESWANNDTCIEVNAGDAAANLSGIAVGGGGNSSKEISALQYFRDYLLQQPANLDNGPGVPDWRLAICLIAAWLIIGGCLYRGVKSSGKTINQFITPRWEKIIEAKVWYNAVTQSFFSLSVGFGPVIMYSSHNDFRHNIYRDSLIISLMDTITSLLAGFTIFSILGYLQYVTNTKNFDDIVTGGTSLVFVAYPTAIASFETVPQLFAVIFFLVLLTLGIGSAMGLASAGISVVQDKLVPIFKNKIKPEWITVAMCIIFFFIALVFITPGGQWVLDLVDFFGGGFIIYILATIECACLMWIYTYARYRRDVQFMINIKLGFYWRFCLQFFVPVALIALFIYFLLDFKVVTYNGGLAFPLIGRVFGWILFGVSMAMLPVAFFFTCKNMEGETIIKKIVACFKPNEKHGPKNPKVRKAWERFKEYDINKQMKKFAEIPLEATQDERKWKDYQEIQKIMKEKLHYWDTFQEEKKVSFVKRSIGRCCGDKNTNVDTKILICADLVPIVLQN